MLVIEFNFFERNIYFLLFPDMFAENISDNCSEQNFFPKIVPEPTNFDL